MTEPRRLYRSRGDRVLAGVCGGLATHLNMDPTLVRVLWVVVTLFSVGAGIVAYIVLALVMPEEPQAPPHQADWHRAPDAETEPPPPM